MNKQLREFEKESGLDVYGLGARRDKWEAALEKFAELIVKECASVQHKRFCEHGDVSWDILMEHFGVEE